LSIRIVSDVPLRPNPITAMLPVISLLTGKPLPDRHQPLTCAVARYAMELALATFLRHIRHP
jgi:hypothetical protein